MIKVVFFLCQFFFQNIDIPLTENAAYISTDTIDYKVYSSYEEFQSKELEGEKDQILLVNFWATWCGPCRAEMPDINRVYEDERDRGFNVVAIDLMETEEQIRRFIDDDLGGLSFTIGLDPDGDVNSEYRIVSYPTSFLIDGNGIIVLKHSGGFTEKFLRDELEEKFGMANVTTAILG